MSNTDVVMAFINAVNDMNWKTVGELFADDIFYHNIPMDPVNGKEAALGFLTSMNAESIHWEMIAIAENGSDVLTERVDNFVLPGDKKLSLPVMGTFVVEDGKITKWRDYFCMNQFMAQMA